MILVTCLGELNWMVKSAEPTSMPSSSEEVHIRAFSRCSLKSSSICTLMSLDREPWWTPTLKASSHRWYRTPSASA